MTLWATLAMDLANDVPSILRSASEAGTNIPEIAQPIDAGANTLLEPYRDASSKLKYSPFLVERLMDEISLHINSCTRIREQAQQLEVQAFREALDIRLKQELVGLIQAHLEKAKDRDPKVISNQTTLAASATTITAPEESEPDKQYWQTYTDLRNGQLNSTIEELNFRL